MEDKGSYPHLQRASRDGSDQRNCWTLEQLECLWAELDMLLTGVDDRRAQLHGERAALTVWMALSMLKSPPLSQPLDDESDRGPARTRSAANAGGTEGLGLTRQQSVTLNSRGATARTSKPETDAPLNQKVEPVSAAAGGAKKAAVADPPEEWEGEAAGYTIRRVSAEADPEALWNFTDAYFAPVPASAADVLDADVRIRRFCGDDVDTSVDPFEVLPRGRHYLEQWEEEARLLASILPNGVGAFSTPTLQPPALAGGGGASAERLHWQLDAGEQTTFTPRVFNALVDQPGFVPRIDIAPTRAGAVDALSQPTPPAVMAVCAECDMREFSARLEDKLRLELVRVGLLDSAADEPGDEDDSLCAELRLAQAQLRAAVAQNEALCHESRLKLDRWLEGQQLDEHTRADSDALVERWRVVMKRLKAERKAERKRKKLGNLKVAGRKAADPTTAAAAAAAPCRESAEGSAPAAAEAGAADDVEAPAMGAEGEANGDGNSNDESSEEEREEDPGPGWGAAAPEGIATMLASNAKAERPTTARKRATRANPRGGGID
jgi:hypothetical protein